MFSIEKCSFVNTIFVHCSTVESLLHIDLRRMEMKNGPTIKMATRQALLPPTQKIILTFAPENNASEVRSKSRLFVKMPKLNLMSNYLLKNPTVS